jgi:hypothetical protein
MLAVGSIPIHPRRLKKSIANRSPVCLLLGRNEYRLITRPLYASQKVFILKVMTHAEYDKNKWQKECGCFALSPKKSKSPHRGIVTFPG